MHFFKYLYRAFLFLFIFGCASSPIVQPQINSLAVGGQYRYALKLLTEYKEKGYGYNNRLMYYLDSGMVNHYAGNYRDSINDFERAKKIYDDLYTLSISKGVESWLVNDNTSPYRGEDHERVMINIFQAVNFMMLDDIEEAVVEARDVDEELNLINSQYQPKEKNKYREDAFARFLAGVLYETEGSSSDLNNAYISYKKAVESYQNNFTSLYDVKVPELLKQNYLAVAELMGDEEFLDAQKKLGDIDYINLKDRQDKGEVYLIVYYGLAPIKRGSFIPIPLPDGYMIKFAFPNFDPRSERTVPGVFEAKGSAGKVAEDAEIMTDISRIAMQTFNDRRSRVIAKSAARMATKYLTEKTIESNLRKSQGENTADWFRYLSSIYNLASEQPDLRSWQTLPSDIRMARLLLAPGEYEFFYNDQSIGIRKVKAGETIFIPIRKLK
jgi:hypothetical protein